MLIELFKRRNARLKGPVVLYHPEKSGVSVILDLKKPQEVDDKWGHKILGEYSDIVRLVEKPKPAQEKESKPKAKKKK